MSEPADLSVSYVDGLAQGEVFQFAIGDWRSGKVSGPAFSEAAFELIEPLIVRVTPEWRDGSRYGVTKMSGESVNRLAHQLTTSPDPQVATLFSGVAKWLEDACKRGLTVTILGI